MNWAIGFALSIIAASILLIVYKLRRPDERLVVMMLAGRTSAMLGFYVLAAVLLPSGTIGAITQTVFLVAAFVGLALEIRATLIARRRG